MLSSKKLKTLLLFLLVIAIPLTVFAVTHMKLQTTTAPAVLSVANTDESVLNITPSPIKTVFVIVMENQNWEDIKSSPSASYIRNILLPNSSYANAYFNPKGVHPSERNYLWMEAGTDFGVKNDNSPSDNHQSSTKHLTTLLSANGISWKSYQEDIDGTTCPLDEKGFYAPRHNPMVFFDDVTDNNNPMSVNCTLHIRPFTEFLTDLAKSSVAQYNFITPNLCNDMHGADGCPTDTVATGDTWLATVVPHIINSQTYKDGGVLFITWDEGATGLDNQDSDGPIGMMVMSPYAKGSGYSNTIHYTHSSLLRTLEEIFTVSPMLGDAASATDLSDLFLSLSTGTKKIALESTTPTKATAIAIPTHAPTKLPTHVLKPTIIATKAPTRIPSMTKALTPTPTVTLAQVIADVKNWIPYTPASKIENLGLSFSYPDTWKVFYRNDTKTAGAQSTYDFLFYPIGNQNLKGVDEKETLSVDVYAPSKTIQDFVRANFTSFADAAIYSVYGNIGNRQMYAVSLPPSDPRAAAFGMHGIVLGTNHAYDLGFTDVMSQNIVDQIGSLLFPFFKFE